MGLLAFIILGAIIGWLASRLMGRHEGFIASAIIGIVGSLIGGFISRAITGGNQSALTFSWAALLWAFIGSIVLVAIMNAFSGRRHHTNTTV